MSGQLGCGFLSEQQSNFVPVKIDSLLKSHSFNSEAGNIPKVKEICCSSNCFYVIIEENNGIHVYQTKPHKRMKQPEEMDLKPLLLPGEIPIQVKKRLAFFPFLLNFLNDLSFSCFLDQVLNAVS